MQKPRWATLFRTIAVASALLLTSASGGAQPGQSAAVGGEKIHPALLTRMAETSEAIKTWVFFTDKGIANRQQYDAAIRRVADRYNARAVHRRALRADNARRGGALFDEYDLPVVQAYVDGVTATGAKVHITSTWLNAVSVYATAEQINAIAQLPYVAKMQPVARRARIEPPEPAATPPPAPAPPIPGLRVSYGNSQGQLQQMNLIALHNEGFTGAGVVVGMLDTGFKRSHEAYNYPGHVLNVIAEYDFLNDDSNAGIDPGDPLGQHDHGTETLSCLGAYRPGTLVGGAYDASFILCKTEDTTGEYPAEEDNYVAGLQFIEANGGDMVTSSLGYIDWYTQADLDGQTAVTTIAANIATVNGLHFCNAAGNEYHDSNPTTSSLIAPADAFQVITCGAVDSSGGIAYFSSDGPTADGRVKPEVLARGVSAAVVSPSSDTGYTYSDGTSFATPLVACCVACLIQANPHWTPDEMRDHLFTTADYYATYGTFDPLYVRGYGIVNAFAAYADCNLNGVNDACDVDCGAPGGECDVPGCGGSSDCNNNLVPDECEADCNGNGVPDDCDIQNCPPGDATCADCNSNGLPDECDVPFPQTGTIALDRTAYACAAAVTVTVRDCGLNIDDAVVDQVAVAVDSDSESGIEQVLLTETGPSTREFVGSIDVATTNAPGVLLVTEGDGITATYVDADDGLGGADVPVVATAVVDCTSPTIWGIAAVDIQPRSAKVVFNTDEAAVGTVHYGTSCASLAGSVAEVSASAAHSIMVAGLDNETTYYYAVAATDDAGNQSYDDNSGACYAFTTPKGPSVLLVDDDDNSPDVRSYYTAALEAVIGPDYDVWNTNNTDNEPDAAALSQYEMVIWFTGDEYGGAAGPGAAGESALGSYLDGGGCLFISGQDYYYDRGLTAFFTNYLGVSSVSSDVDQTTVAGAGVFAGFGPYALNYPFSNYSDTVQPNGTAQVAFTGNVGNAAVSKDSGTYRTTYWGFPFEAVPSAADRAALMAAVLEFCGAGGPEPPVAQNMPVTTAVDTALTIGLQATDDGDPNPPGAMTYLVTSLPTGALRDAADDHLIAAGELPYTLAGGGNTVDYTPTAGSAGPDSFQFKANDGGSPPDAGDSNVATVMITVGGPAWNPVAHDVDTTTAVSQATDIALDATDPNGDALTFVIETLPEFGYLRDPAGGEITSNALPYVLAGGSEVVRYQPPCGQIVTDSFEFSARDATASSNVATVIVGVTSSGPRRVYSFPLDTDPGWQTEGQWAFGQPTGGGTHNHDPAGGHTGSNVYGYDLGGDYTHDMPQYALTAGPIDCTNVTGTELRFQRWLGVEYTDKAGVEVSADGETWTPLWENPLQQSIADMAWIPQSFDISSVADGNSTVYVRWTMGPTDGTITYPGWNIDDVEIWGVVPFDASDFDGDGMVTVGDYAILADCLDGPELQTSLDCRCMDLDSDGDVDLVDYGAMQRAFGP